MPYIGKQPEIDGDATDIIVDTFGFYSIFGW